MKKCFISEMLTKACDHNDGVINTNRITKQPTVKWLSMSASLKVLVVQNYQHNTLKNT